MQEGLGRWHAPDARDEAYRLATVMGEEELPSYKHWYTGPPLDQNGYPHCVGYSLSKFLVASPLNTRTGPAPEQLYREAQKLDEWAGENYDGTSVRGGIKALAARGHIAEYRWSWDVGEIARWLLTRGTVVLGTIWPESYFYPRPDGFVELDLSRLSGGHAYLACGYSETLGAVRCMNSWGSEWGDRGRFWIPGEDLQELLDRDGEACCGLERKVG